MQAVPERKTRDGGGTDSHTGLRASLPVSGMSEGECYWRNARMSGDFFEGTQLQYRGGSLPAGMLTNAGSMAFIRGGVGGFAAFGRLVFWKEPDGKCAGTFAV